MSHSRYLYERFSGRTRQRKFAAAIYVAAMLAYVAWRLTIVNPDAPGLSYLYFTAEVFGFVLGITLIFSSWNFRHREPPHAASGLSVDVFVTTYKEPVELVRWTLIGALEIGYPHRTFLLDDGNRPEMKALAEELGARYLARGDNIGAKAGNLNFGLAHSKSDFVMVFDADHIALPCALDLTLGFFAGSSVGMVQTPQDYYNVDSFQHLNARRRGGLWHDQSFFYLIAQSARDYFNGASCVGTCVVYRRSALDAIGGFPVETVTEDIQTSLKMHKANYEVVYLNEPIAYGLAAADIRDYYRTRHRWAHGNIHVLRLENVIFCSDLTLQQKLSYLSLGLIYLEGWQQLILFAVPMISLFFGWAPFEITFFNVLVILFFPLMTTLLLQELGCGLGRIWANEIFAMARFPVHLIAATALVRGKMVFRTSVKNLRGQIEWWLMTPQIAVLAMSVAAIGWGLSNLAADFQVGPLVRSLKSLLSGNLRDVDWNIVLVQGYTVELVAVAGAWALFNAVKAGYLIRKAIVDAQKSSDDYRFEVRLPLELHTEHGRRLATIERLSRSWLSARISDQPDIPLKRILSARLFLPSGPVSVGLEAINLADGKLQARMSWHSTGNLDRLTRSLFSVNWYREFIHRDAFFLTPSDFLQVLAGLRWPRSTRRLDWRPVLVIGALSEQVAVGVLGLAADGGHASFLTFREMEQDDRVAVEILLDGKVRNASLRIGRPEPLHTLADRGLDGEVMRRYQVRVEEATLGEAVLSRIAAE